MIDLGSYMYQNTIDGHIHLFDKDGCTGFSKDNKYVCFCDIEPKYIDQYLSTENYYKDFIDNNYNDNMILLATSADPREMISIHKKWPDKIKGFGEIKCYKEWNGKDLKLNRLSKYWDLFKYAEENNLPIYIHYSLAENNWDKFDRLLKRFPETKVVLCHCGMDHWTNNDFCYHTIMDLMRSNKNLWVDVSWVALKYFNDNPFKLINMDRDRMILGSDMNKITMNEDNYRKEWNKIHNLASMINSDKNIKRLFKL